MFNQRLPPPLKSLLVAKLLLAASFAYADGFHYRIQVATTFIATPKSELQALQMHWTYDAAMSEALELSKTTSADALKHRADMLAKDLLELGYFSQLAIDSQPVQLGVLQNPQISVNTDNGFTFSFTLPLKAANPITGKNISLSLADPDGIGILKYSDATKVTLDSNLAKICTPATVTNETITLPNGHQPNIPTVKITCK